MMKKKKFIKKIIWFVLRFTIRFDSSPRTICNISSIFGTTPVLDDIINHAWQVETAPIKGTEGMFSTRHKENREANKDLGESS